MMPPMVTPRGQRELERTASWVAVRRGLGWLIGMWVVLTLAGVGVQLQSMRLAPLLALKDPGALVLMAMVSVGYQGFYALASLALAAALLRLTRVPPATGAVTPALVATVCFVLVTLLGFALLFGATGGSSEGISQKELWVLVAAARAGGLVALVLALTRMASALGARVPQAFAGACFAFVAIDVGFPLYRLLSGATDAQAPTQRTALLVVQILLAVLLIELARRVRRASAQLARDEVAAPPPDPAAKEEAKDVPGPAARPAAEPRPVSEASRVLAPVLLFVLVAIFPAWDALGAASSVGALSDAVRGAVGTQPPTTALLFAAGGVGAALLLRQLMGSSPYGARGVFALVVLVVAGYAVPRTYEVALWRSHQVDAWPVCETGVDVDGNLPTVESVYRGAYDGSRLTSGEPCIQAAERRDEHAARAPRGDFSDGIVQIGTRFPDDRKRVLWGTLAWLVLAGLCAVLVWRAADAQRPAVSETRAESADARAADDEDDEDDTDDEDGSAR